jgi:hypothetical protein
VPGYARGPVERLPRWSAPRSLAGRLTRFAATARRHEYVTATVALALIACFWFWPLFKGDQLSQAYTFFDQPPWAASHPGHQLPERKIAPDVALTSYPWAVVARDQLRDGELPLWNPYEFGGTTLAGNMQSAQFFPLTWLLLVLPLGYAWGVVAVAKLVIAGLGTYALSRELRIARGGALLAGTVYMLSAPLIAWVQWPLGSAFGLFPWLLLATSRLERARCAGSVAAVAVAFALTILAGHPESALIAVSAATVFLLVLLALQGGRLRVAVQWLAGLVLGVAAAAAAVVPFAQAWEPSITRSADSSFGLFVRLPESLSLTYALPGLFGNGEPDLYTSGVSFNSVAASFGLPALLLAGIALARYRRRPAALALAAMAAVALMTAYGIPPVSWFVDNVPPWSKSILAERCNFVVALAGAVGAGAGFGALSRHPLPPRRVAAVVAGAGLAIAIAFVLAELRGGLPAPASVKRESLALGLVFLVATGGLLVALRWLRPPLALTIVLGLALLSVAGMRDFNVTLPPDEAYPAKPAAVAALQRQPGPYRVGAIRHERESIVLPANTAALYGLESVEGYDFPLSRRWHDFQSVALGFRGFRAETRYAAVPPDRRMLAGYRMMNTRYYVAAPGARAPAPGFEVLHRGPDATVFRDPGALPRAWVVSRTRPLGYRETLAALIEGRLDPRREALVPRGSPSPPEASRPGFRAARVEQLGGDHVRVHLAPGSAGWLVLANAYAPTWNAEVDGQEAEIRPTNLAAMGLPVSASARTVEFRLDRTGFWLGVAISLVALAAIATLAVVGPLRRRGSDRPC